MSSSSPFGQAAIITALKGQTLRIPNLTSLFQSWPSPSLNTHYPELVSLASSTILNIAAAAPQLHIERRLRDDIALLACLWFPYAQRKEIEALVLFAVWVVCWDDTVDANEGDLAADFAGAEEWRNKTLQIARTAFQLPEAAQNGAVDAINAVLVSFGQRYIEGGAPLEQRQRMYDETSIFIRACATEQKMRLGEAMPGFDEYMALREGTIGGGVMCALVPFAMGRNVPFELIDSPHVAVLLKQANILLSLLNDTLSLKKELHTDCVINAVCTLFTPETPLDEVMTQIYQKMQDAVRRFNEAAGELINQFLTDDNLHSLAKDLIDGYRSIVTGTLEFT
jgi:hypothetical protein